ncbi:MAG TPA: transcription antitermination factor NusB, partial [Longimicrobiales bacterium]|nr:transcription antitermination factor NusB [Longimicrobiales bacterium]
MGKATAARKAALNIMRAIRSGELADRAFARQVDQVPPRDVAFLHELVYGMLRLRGRMDYVLGTYVRKGLNSLDDDALDVLRLG